MPSLLEIGPLVLEKKFIAISLLSSLENRVALHFNKLESPYLRMLNVPSLVEIGLVVLEKTKMWKVYVNENNDDETDTDKFLSNFFIKKGNAESVLTLC